MDHKIDTKVASICDAAKLAAPPTWASIKIDIWANVMTYEIALSAKNEKGLFGGEMRHVDLGDQVRALRADMYEQERGTWLSAQFLVFRNQEPEVSFNYDNDPNWSPALHPMMLVRDLEAYPRIPEHTPQWLRDTVALGLELEREHQTRPGNQ
ncbi:hypothetical protein ACTWPB_08955 [Nocardia sp. IBHARD005]|uniref:hypothetical protein n=1 Tax=Nocardia sp. IBHARD005 TaxID=3457765 RepID=UPI004059E7E2